MAPKRGGGGSSSLSNAANSSESRCADTAISDPTNVGRLVINGLCLLLALGLIGLYIRALRRTRSLKELLPWYTFGLLLVLTVVYLILGILTTVLGSCFIIGSLETAELSVPASVISGLSNILLLGILLLTLTRRLLLHGGQKPQLFATINSVLVGLTGIIFVPAIVLSNMASLYRFTSGIDNPTKALIASLSVKLSLTFFTMYFVAALVGSGVLLFALLKTTGMPVYHPIETKVWATTTIVTLLLGSGSVLVQMYGWVLPNHALPKAAWIAFLAIFNVLFMITIFSVFQLAQTIVAPTVDPTDDATYDPDSTEETQPALHKRFTYTGALDPPLQRNRSQENPGAWPLASASPNPQWPLTSPTKTTFGFGGHQPPGPVVQHAF